MSDDSPSPGSPAPGPAGTSPAPFGERLRVPWWWWPPVIGVAVLMSAEVHLGYPGVRAWLPYLVLLPLAVALLVWLGRLRVEVAPDPTSGEPEVRAGTARLPVRSVGRVDVVRGPSKQQALGPDLDPTALVLHRPWVPGAVRLEVLDPDDPAPYWVISSRQPERLVAALTASGAETDEAGPDLTPRSRGR